MVSLNSGSRGAGLGSDGGCVTLGGHVAILEDAVAPSVKKKKSALGGVACGCGEGLLGEADKIT